MDKKIYAFIAIALLLFANLVYGQKQFKTVKAVATRTPVIDGKFIDEEWIYGGLATEFIQVEPKEGVPASEKTEAYFLYDKENLYVGVKCFDSEPDKIMSEISGRDNEGASDFIALAFDTFRGLDKISFPFNLHKSLFLNVDKNLNV